MTTDASWSDHLDRQALVGGVPAASLARELLWRYGLKGALRTLLEAEDRRYNLADNENHANG